MWARRGGGRKGAPVSEVVQTVGEGTAELAHFAAPVNLTGLRN